MLWFFSLSYSGHTVCAGVLAFEVSFVTSDIAAVPGFIGLFHLVLFQEHLLPLLSDSSACS